MKKIDSHKTKNAKQRAVRAGLLVLSALLLVTGIVLLLIDPIKRANRNNIANDAMRSLESKIFSSETDNTQWTYIVPRTGNEVEGEDYDFIGETEETTDDGSGDGGMVVLNAIGILEISRINCRYTVWDEASQVSLRYGLGHYVDSVMPGEIGNATILGHNYRDGTMFHRLGELQVGDAVVFTGTDGVSKTFYVEESKIISADELLNYALGDITDSRQLTLVTCTYEYGRYGWRRVVICRLADDSVPEETAAPTEDTVATDDTAPEETIEATETAETVTEATEAEGAAPPDDTSAENPT